MDSNHTPTTTDPTSVYPTTRLKQILLYLPGTGLFARRLSYWLIPMLLLVAYADGRSQVQLPDPVSSENLVAGKESAVRPSIVSRDTRKGTRDTSREKVFSGEQTSSRPKQSSLLRRLLTFPLRLGKTIIGALRFGEGGNANNNHAVGVVEVVDSKILVNDAASPIKEASGEQPSVAITGGESGFSVAYKSSAYIEFERIGYREPLYARESEQGIWLRLYNNTSQPIVFNIHGVPSEDYGDAALIYDVLSDGRVVEPDSCHACSFKSLGLGGSLLFSVPAEHLSEGRSLRIKFKYGDVVRGEGDRGTGPDHYVYYEAAQLPKNILRSP